MRRIKYAVLLAGLSFALGLSVVAVPIFALFAMGRAVLVCEPNAAVAVAELAWAALAAATSASPMAWAV